MLRLLDIFGYQSHDLKLEDPEVFLFKLAQCLDEMPKPCRVITDSLTPLAIAHAHDDFVSLVYRKNRLLRQPGVVLFDIFLKGILKPGLRASLLNAYDISIELYRPDWGEMSQLGNSGYPSLHVTKARGIKADTRPYPYRIREGEGIVVQTDYY